MNLDTPLDLSLKSRQPHERTVAQQPASAIAPQEKAGDAKTVRHELLQRLPERKRTHSDDDAGSPPPAKRFDAGQSPTLPHLGIFAANAEAARTAANPGQPAVAGAARTRLGPDSPSLTPKPELFGYGPLSMSPPNTQKTFEGWGRWTMERFKYLPPGTVFDLDIIGHVGMALIRDTEGPGFTVMANPGCVDPADTGTFHVTSESCEYPYLHPVEMTYDGKLIDHKSDLAWPIFTLLCHLNTAELPDMPRL